MSSDPKRKITEADCMGLLRIGRDSRWVLLTKYPRAGDTIWRFVDVGKEPGTVIELSEDSVRTWMEDMDRFQSVNLPEVEIDESPSGFTRTTGNGGS